MGLFEHFPFTNFHEMNLDWIIKEIKNVIAKSNETAEKVENILGSEKVEETIRQTITDAINDGTLATSTSWLWNKKIVVYGDSSGTIENNYVDKLKDLGLLVTNRCIGGSTLSPIGDRFPDYRNKSGYELINSATDLNNFDFVFLIYGINDWQVDVPLRDNNLISYDYASKEIVRICNNKGATPVFIFPHYCNRFPNNYNVNNRGISLESYINSGIETCEITGTQYINLYVDSPCNIFNFTRYLKNDNGVFVHGLDNLTGICAKIIASGKTGQGFCRSGFWSDNLAETMKANSFAEYDPNRVANYHTKDTALVLKNIMSEKGTIHVSGYSEGSGMIRIFNGSGEQDVKITTGYFDFFVDVEKGSDFYVIPTVNVNKFSVRVLNKDPQPIGALYTVTSNNNCTVSAGTVYNVDGFTCCDWLRFKLLQDVKLGDSIITSIPFLSGKIVGVNGAVIRNGVLKYTMFYLASGSLRCNENLKANDDCFMSFYIPTLNIQIP